MPLTDDQLETLARQLTHIARWADQLHSQLEPGPPALTDGEWHRPVFGPRPPCSISLLDLLLDTEERLRAYAGNLAQDTLGSSLPGADITPREWAESRSTIPALCRFIRTHRRALAPLEWAPDAADDINQIHRHLADRAEPPLPVPTNRKEVKGAAAVLSKVATQLTGRSITRKQITYWGNAGYITRHPGTAGETTYLLDEVLRHAESQ